MWEACHGVVIKKGDTSTYLDVNGLNTFEEEYDSFMFSSMPSEVRLTEYEEDFEHEFEELFGELEQVAVEKANVFFKHILISVLLQYFHIN